MQVNSKSSTSFGRKLYFFQKRIFDIIMSIIGLVFLLPVFIIIIIAIKLDSKGPAIFVQERIGKNGKLFKFYKFRSMVENADDVLFEMLKGSSKEAEEYRINKKLENDPRITKVGKIIRKCSLDELPQLLNILKGDMSFIGNRPYLEREIPDMGDYYKDIIKSKPGLTGLWQVNGRSNTTFETRLKLEKKYSEEMCFLLDLKIFIKTFVVVLKTNGAS